ncbi:MAG: NAD(P)-binding protein [bacterium]
MRLMVLGAGLMGRAAAWELSRHEGAEVLVVDGRTGALSAAGSCGRDGSGRCPPLSEPEMVDFPEPYGMQFSWRESRKR